MSQDNVAAELNRRLAYCDEQRALLQGEIAAGTSKAYAEAAQRCETIAGNLEMCAQDLRILKRRAMGREEEARPQIDPELIKHFEEARHWKCQCGERCNPGDSKWRWNGRDWEHHHGYPAGHVDTEFRKLAAHNTGDGWYLHELDQENNVIDENGLPWPADWPESVNALFLKERGYEIVP